MRHDDCTRCPLHEYAFTIGMDGRGPLDASIMIVAIAPSSEDDLAGSPLIGKTGSYLDDMLRDAGFDPATIRITNAVRCRGKDSEITPPQVDACRQWLIEEIHTVKPEVIIAMGDIALKALCKRSGITDKRGKFIELHADIGYQCPVLPTYHPNFLLKGKLPLRGTVVSDLARVRDRGLETEKINWKWWGGKLPAGDVLSYDVETDYFVNDKTTNNVIQAAVTGDDEVAFVARTDADLREMLTQIIDADKAGRTILGHNSWKADRPWCNALLGEDVMPMGDDTMVMAYLIDETQPRGLESLCVKYLGVRGWKEGLHADPNSDLFAEYNCFSRHTRVVMSDGKNKEIHSIKPGEYVKTVVNGKLTTRKVLNTIDVIDDRPWVSVKVDGAVNGSVGVVCTPDHEWITTSGARVQAKNLEHGTPLPLSSKGSSDLILGTLLGDGHAYKRQGALGLAHSNEEWIKAKARHLGVKVYYKASTLSAYKGSKGVWELTCSIPKYWRKDLYNNKDEKRWVPPSDAALAVFYGDDGCLANGKYARISAFCFEDKELVRQWFQARFGNASMYNSGVVGLLEDASPKFFEAIAPWLHPSMEYKLPLEYRGRYNGWLEEDVPRTGRVISVTEKIHTHDCYKPKHKYCLTVEDSGTFFTLGGLVSNCRDTVFTLRLYRHLLPVLGHRKAIADRIIKPAFLALEECTRVGIYVDAEAVTKAREHYGPILEDLRTRVCELSPVEAKIENPNSTDQVGTALLFEGHLLKPTPKTGKPSTTAAVVAELRQTPLVEALSDYREAAKLVGTYIKPYEKIASSDDPRVHSQFTVANTTTGRTSSAKQNVQNIPRNDLLRNMLYAKPGYELCEIDYSSIEFRLAAMLANERGILERYEDNPDWDAHTFVACRYFGIEESEGARLRSVKDRDFLRKRNEVAKSANFGLLFGSSANGLYEYAKKVGAKLTIAECETLRNFWHQTFPGFGRFYVEVRDEIIAKGYVESITGRRRHVGDWNMMSRKTKADSLRECINFKVQSLAADIALLGLGLCHKYGQPIVSFVHDANYFEYPIGQSERKFVGLKMLMVSEPLRILKEEFNVEITVPLLVEMKVKPNHGLKKVA